mgnify:CR=1 FL=1
MIISIYTRQIYKISTQKVYILNTFCELFEKYIFCVDILYMWRELVEIFIFSSTHHLEKHIIMLSSRVYFPSDADAEASPYCYIRTVDEYRNGIEKMPFNVHTKMGRHAVRERNQGILEQNSKKLLGDISAEMETLIKKRGPSIQPTAVVVCSGDTTPFMTLYDSDDPCTSLVKIAKELHRQNEGEKGKTDFSITMFDSFDIDFEITCERQIDALLSLSRECENPLDEYRIQLMAGALNRFYYPNLSYRSNERYLKTCKELCGDKHERGVDVEMSDTPVLKVFPNAGKRKMSENHATLVSKKGKRKKPEDEDEETFGEFIAALKESIDRPLTCSDVIHATKMPPTIVHASTPRLLNVVSGCVKVTVTPAGIERMNASEYTLECTVKTKMVDDIC